MAKKAAQKKGNGKYSDDLANGDKDDDRELQNEDDPRDAIVDDNGFSRQWVRSGEHVGVMLNSEVHLQDEGDDDSGYQQAYTNYNQVLAGNNKGLQAPGAFSQELSNGDATDDLQVEKEGNFDADGMVDEAYI